MENKLEIKYLAPYLPYGLRYTFDNVSYWLDAKLKYTAERFDFGTLLRLTTPDQTTNVIGIKWDDDKNGLSAFTELSSIYHKPILRPLSDLAFRTSPLTIVDLNRMRGVTLQEDKYDVVVDDGYCIICKWGGVFSFWFERQTTSFYDNSVNGISPQLEMFMELFRYHFDVFGLIEKGLAIDINTMKKQSKQEEQREEEKIAAYKEDIEAEYSEQQRIEDDEAERENEQPNWNIN